MAIHIFGIRHHGPGCARSLERALEQLQPDVLLIEGPPEGNELLPLGLHADMQPPVAVLIYSPAMPQHAVYYPFAAFSPEWQAIRYGLSHGMPTSFIDLPLAHTLAQEITIESPDPVAAPAEEEAHDDENQAAANPASWSDDDDALTWLAHAAGFSDSETWWDHLVEQRQDSLELFAAIEEMMTVARQEMAIDLTPREAQREAHMRQMIRQAVKQGGQRIAVVCGAWHVSALRDMPSAKHDAELLKNLPKTKVAATWTPWSYGRLTFASGYGAGVQAPGWYHHLWQTPDRAALYWLTDAARLLRKHDLDASSAHIIEALRLSETLACLRERSRPGLGELLEATQSVLFGDSSAPMRLIEKDLLINDRLGAIPADAPILPLPQDVRQLQKRYRLQPSADQVTLDLDLRQPAHLEKSVFLHRLALLGIDWGTTRQASGKSGSFHEIWQLQWEPEYALKLIEANVWGATVEVACTAQICHKAQQASRLPDLTSLVERMLLADAKPAIQVVMARMQALSATTHDAGMLLEALPPLANVLRYGNVRGTDTSSVALVLNGLVVRACIALPQAAVGINAEAAQALLTQMIQANLAIHLLQQADHLEAWYTVLEQCATRNGVNALVAGRAVRILTEQENWDVTRTAQVLSLACSNPVNPAATAEWLEGFLKGSGLLLVMNDTLWHILNDWVASLPDKAFTELLPLLRRTFSTFEAPERQQLAQRVGNSGPAARPQIAQSKAMDVQRAALVLPLLCQILSANEAAASTEVPA